MRLAAYYRVSTEAQAGEDRFGLDRQKNLISEWAKTNGHEIVSEYEDHASGTTADRSDLSEMISREEIASKNYEGVVVAAWDRLARDTMLDGYLRYSMKKNGLQIFSATQSNGIDPVSKLTQDILAAIAGYERHLICARMMGGRNAKRKKGGYADGQPPYGMKSIRGSKVLHVNEAEMQNLNHMVSLRDKKISLRGIQAILNEAEVYSRSGKPWAISSISSALKNSTKVVELVSAIQKEES